MLDGKLTLIFAVVDGLDAFIEANLIVLEVVAAGVLVSILRMHFDGSHEIVLVLRILLVLFIEVFGKPAELGVEQRLPEVDPLGLSAYYLGSDILYFFLAHPPYQLVKLVILTIKYNSSKE